MGMHIGECLAYLCENGGGLSFRDALIVNNDIEELLALKVLGNDFIGGVGLEVLVYF